MQIQINMLLPKRYEKQCEYLLKVKSDDIDIYIGIINFATQRDRKTFLHLHIFKYCKYS